MIRRASQPKAPKTAGRPVYDFVIQEMPDPWGHLTEEQKKWPLCDLDAPRTPSEAVMDPATETEFAPKPTESRPEPC